VVAQVCLNQPLKYTEEQKELIIKTYFERGSLRGMRRLFGVAPATLTKWIKKSQQSDSDHVTPSESG
jgi:transposase-like protein